ncbi:MAG: hypothetical protein ACYCZF_08575 [Anaerolineae bacterium]
MFSLELGVLCSLSLAAVIVLASGTLYSHPRFGAYCHWLRIASALIASAGLVWQAITDQSSLYGRWGGASAVVGFGLVWALCIWPNPNKRVTGAASVLAALLLIAGWLPAASGWPRVFLGGWFWLAQIATAMGVSFWCYAACMLIDPKQEPFKPIVNWALLLQIVGIFALAIGAQRTWGRALSWDPVECWWLFAAAMSALALCGGRQQNWRNRLVAPLGLVPALLGWFGSWFIIQALHLASLYLAGA